MEFFISIVLPIAAIIISVIAIIPSFKSTEIEQMSLREQAYQQFAQMWFELDKIFIDHPYMHKYFYKFNEKQDYVDLKPEEDNYDLGICIAEMFCDVFQYSEPLEKYLTKEDRDSYRDYKKMIMACPIVQRSLNQHKWHE